MDSFDIIVIGAGIAGASVAARLAPDKTVCILEMEDRAGYHSTGRSAAMFVPNYGPPPILAVTRASFDFFNAPPPGFTDTPLLTRRGTLMLEAEGQQSATAELLSFGVGLKELTEAQAQTLFPVLRQGYAKRFLLDPNTFDIDVDLLHRGFLKMAKSGSAELVTSAPLTALKRNGAQWHVTAGAHKLTAPVVVNAAGAWGDEIAKLAGVKPVGLIPKRRSIGVIPVPDQTGLMSWPMLMDTAETWYGKPQSGKLLISSADETPVDPHDAYADDLAIAEGVESLMAATTLVVDRLEHSWGGLRTFPHDGNPVVGFDPSTDGFFWHSGLGGYGIQSSPALSEVAASLLLGGKVPAYILAAGLNLAEIQPDRFQ